MLDPTNERREFRKESKSPSDENVSIVPDRERAYCYQIILQCLIYEWTSPCTLTGSRARPIRGGGGDRVFSAETDIRCK